MFFSWARIKTLSPVFFSPVYRLGDNKGIFEPTQQMGCSWRPQRDESTRQRETGASLCRTIQGGGGKTKRNHISPSKHKYTNTQEKENKMSTCRHTHSGSALARALAATALALVLVRAKSRGRRVLPNAAVICFGNATAVSSHGPSWEMTARVGQGDSSVCSGAGTLQVMFSKALLNLMACKIR